MFPLRMHHLKIAWLTQNSEEEGPFKGDDAADGRRDKQTDRQARQTAGAFMDSCDIVPVAP